MVMEQISMVLIAFLVLLIYFIPSFIAKDNRKRNFSAILVLNIFLGWTIICWVICLVWAVMKDPENRHNELEPIEEYKD